MDSVSWMLVIGRILLGGVFVLGGIRHAFVYPSVLRMMEARGVPVARLVLLAGSIFQIAAGACMMAGLWVSAAAWGLALFTVAATVMVLDFWNKSGPEREAMANAAVSNAAIVGGLLVAAATA